MRDITYKTRTPRLGALIHVAIGLLLVLAFFGILSQRALAASENAVQRIVTVFDNGVEKTFLTEAATVRDALERANITIDATDAVEPDLDAELVAKTYSINIYRARPVVVVDGEHRATVMSPHKSARQIADKAGIALYAEDTVEVQRISDVLSDGVASQKVVIDRATPISLVLYDKKVTVRTQAATVGEMLKEKEITLAANEGTSVSASTPITPGMTVTVWRDGKTTRTEEQEVAFSTRQIQDPHREIGFKEVQSVGKIGKRIVTFEVEIQNGQEVSRQETHNIVVEQPIEQVEVVGTMPNLTGNRALGKQLMLQAGFSESQWSCLDQLWERESHWNQFADNPYSDAYGIPQSLPASKMASHGADYLTNPETQIRWGLSYIKGRYGTPCGAWSFWQSKSPHWY